jgi:hypothetical protein
LTKGKQSTTVKLTEELSPAESVIKGEIAMLRKVMAALFVATLVTSIAAAAQTNVFATYNNNNEDKVTICHRDNNTNQPYGPKAIEVAESSVDGSGNGDHYREHQGPLASSKAVAEQLKDEHREWGDIIPPVPGKHGGLNWTTAGQAMWHNDCQYINKVTPAAVTFVAPTCEAKGTYTIPNTVGVEYKVGDAVKSAGTYTATTGTHVHVTAVAKTGYVLEGTTHWSYEFKAPRNCDQVVTPTEPTFVAPTCDEYGSFTIPAKTGVVYKVDDEVVTAGTYAVEDDEKITIKAYALEGYELTGTTKWSYSFEAPTDCDEEQETVVPTAVTFVAPTCTAKGTYTIPAKEGVLYQIGGVTKAAGTYTAENGTSVTVVAVADEGYELGEGAVKSWTYTFTAPTNCGQTLGTSTTTPSVPVAATPASLPSTGGDVNAVVAIATAVAGFAVVVSLVAKSAIVKLS